jgi:hypothetical protein
VTYCSKPLALQLQYILQYILPYILQYILQALHTTVLLATQLA